MTEYVGALKDVKAIDLAATAARGALAATGTTAEEIDHTEEPCNPGWKQFTSS